MKKLLLSLTFLGTFQQLSAQSNKVTLAPDCTLNFTFTATGVTSPIAQSCNPIGVAVWSFSFTTNSVPTVVLISVQTAPDVSGSPGSWSDATPTTGNNPNSSTTSANATFGTGALPVAFPWWRVKLTTLTGGGKITGQLYGSKLSAFSGGGGGGGSCSSNNLSPLFNVSLTGCAFTFSQISQTQNKVFASPDGSSGNPLFRALVDADLPATAVTPGTYGDSTHFPQFTVSQTGRLTFAANLTPLPASAGGNYVQNFTAQTSVTLTHNFGTQSVVTECYDGSNGSGNLIIPANIANTDANDTTVTFGASQSGSCVVNASANASNATINTSSNCSSSASPAVCGSAAAGSVAIPTGVTSVALQVNTTAVTANSQVFLFPDDSLGTKLSVTCNSTLATLVGGLAITARSAGASFTVTYNGTIAANPLCVSYLVVN